MKTVRRQVSVVLLCHFTAALVALGMPPFFGLILSDAFVLDGAHWVGWFYVVPTACTALVAPFWGRAADRWGRRWSLLRAQLGLALAFALAGLAPDAWTFFAALVLQGLLGGTFAASNAYLSTCVQGETLGRSLNWMQGSARAAMVLAPILFGALIGLLPPQQLYLYLALLPLLAALLLALAAPADRPDGRRSQDPATPPAVPTPPWRLWTVQAAFTFAMVVTFPYFVPWVQQSAGATAATAGLLYSLPHLVYLGALWRPLGGMLRKAGSYALGAGLLLMALSYAGQALTGSLPGLVLWRTLMGLGMTLGFFALHDWIARLTQRHRAGRSFGALDSMGKWAGVAAGLAAGLISGPWGLAAPLWLGAAALLLALPAAAGARSIRPGATAAPVMGRFSTLRQKD